jgi:hypothetical protein
VIFNLLAVCAFIGVFAWRKRRQSKIDLAHVNAKENPNRDFVVFNYGKSEAGSANVRSEFNVKVCFEFIRSALGKKTQLHVIH